MASLSRHLLSAPEMSADTERSHRASPGLLIAGAGILLYRTIALLAGGAGRILKRWVVGLTIVEMVVDIFTMVGGARWWVSREPTEASLALRAGAVATLLHALRVAVFVLGRTGPCVDFDVRPEKRATHKERWNWKQVAFAGILSVLGVIGVLVIWLVRRKRPVGQTTPDLDSGGDIVPATET